MNFEDFKESLKKDKVPSKLTAELEALWYDGKGKWDTAHDLAQQVPAPNGAWIHAYLHRAEGDDSNAGYWYRRAGKNMPSISISDEWEQLVKEFL